MVVLKLLDKEKYDINIPYSELNSNNSIVITLAEIYSYLVENGLSMQEIENINFIYKGATLEHNTIYNVLDDETIYMYVNNIIIKNEIIKNIYSIKIEQEQEVIEININENIIKQFNDPDFCNILRICLTKPDIINQVNSYLSHGNIVPNIQLIDIENFTFNDEYEHIIKLLTELKYNINEHLIKSVLYHFKGHLNLSLRYLLQIQQQ